MCRNALQQLDEAELQNKSETEYVTMFGKLLDTLNESANVVLLEFVICNGTAKYYGSCADQIQSTIEIITTRLVKELAFQSGEKLSS